METIREAAAAALGDAELRPWASGEDVVETLRGWTDRVRTLLVILDQFEDYFLYHPDEEGEGTFFEEFPAVVNDENLRVHFLVSIREDALAKLDRFKGSIPRLFANYVRVEHLDRAAARRAIEGPVDEWNRRHGDEPPYTLEPALVDAVIDAAADGELALVRNGARATAAPSSNGGVEAPFLQLVMERIWRATSDAGEHDLTLARLEALGGPQRIVENHLLEALGTLTADEQAVAADLFRFLVTRSKTKIAHPASDLAEWTGRSEAEATTVLEKLSAARRRPHPPPRPAARRRERARPATSSSTTSSPTRSSSGGANTSRTSAGRPRSGASPGSQAVSPSSSRSSAASASGHSCSGARRRPRRARRRRSRSRRPRRRSLPTRPDNALLLGLEGYRSSATPEAASAVVDALEAVAALRRDGDPARRAGRRPDDRGQPRREHARRRRLRRHAAPLRPRERKPLGEPFRAHTAEVWGLAFSPDGKTLASSSFDDTVRFWRVEDQSPVGEPIDPGIGAVLTVAFAPDGRTVALGGSADTVQLWQVDPPKLVRTLEGSTGSVHSLAYSPDGTMLAAGGGTTVLRWDARTGKPLGGPLEGHRDTVASVAFSPDGRTIASGGLDGDVRLWSADTGKRDRPAPAERDGPGLERLVQPGREDARVVGVRRDRPALERADRPAPRATRSRATRGP